MTGSPRALGAGAGHRALRTLLIAAAASAGTGLLLAACSASAPETAAGAGAARSAARPAFNSASGARAGASGVARARLALSAQSIIYTAYLTVRVTDVQAAAGAAAGFATAAGGYVSSEQETVPPGRHRVPQVSLELKIPVGQYRAVLAELRTKLGRQLSFSQRAENVTQQVADVNSRVASAQAAITQLRALLRRAGSVSALLAVQNQINSQESDLEALLAQQRALAHETSYATVSVTVLGHHAVVVKKSKKSPGFAAGLRGGWHALGLVVGWLLTALGTILPFAAALALLGGLALAGRHWLARRKAPPAAEPPGAAAS